MKSDQLKTQTVRSNEAYYLQQFVITIFNLGLFLFYLKDVSSEAYLGTVFRHPQTQPKRATMMESKTTTDRSTSAN